MSMMLSAWLSLLALPIGQAQHDPTAEDPETPRIGTVSSSTTPAPIVLSANIDFYTSADAWLSMTCTEANVALLLDGPVSSRTVTTTLFPQPIAGMIHEKEPGRPVFVAHKRAPYTAYDVERSDALSQVLCRGERVLAVNLLPPATTGEDSASQLAQRLGPLLRCSIQDELTRVRMHGWAPSGPRIITVTSMDHFEAVHVFSGELFSEWQALLAPELRGRHARRNGGTTAPRDCLGHD